MKTMNLFHCFQVVNIWLRICAFIIEFLIITIPVFFFISVVFIVLYCKHVPMHAGFPDHGKHTGLPADFSTDKLQLAFAKWNTRSLRIPTSRTGWNMYETFFCLSTSSLLPLSPPLSLCFHLPIFIQHPPIAPQANIVHLNSFSAHQGVVSPLCEALL